MSTETSQFQAPPLEAMFGERPAGLRTDPSGGRQARAMQYWKRPDGYVTIGPTQASDGPEFLRYLSNKRYKPLPLSYGTEVVGDHVAPHPGMGSNIQSIPGTMCSKNGRMQLRNFIANGGLTARDPSGEFGVHGAYLMPREQLIELAMHRQADSSCRVAASR